MTETQEKPHEPAFTPIGTVEEFEFDRELLRLRASEVALIKRKLGISEQKTCKKCGACVK